ncbi:MAG TPA: G1 family glutamic endopeptidase [Candidatus Dormibacteraeota bacterium]|jgi:hypothetical protein|nr:G1 family glutamic endopeptidase [Candidatus Dormibacteraeota bacterium]
MGSLAKTVVFAVVAVVTSLLGHPQATPVPVVNQARATTAAAPAASSTSGWTASNWAGYAITAGGYNEVSATWTVPSVQSGSGLSAMWIGIDGFNNNALIQIGTEQNATSSGGTYYAWWEVLPSAESSITQVPLSAGDQVNARIAKNATDSWTISLTDVTTGASFQTTQSYTGTGTSAEWIMEAPNLGSQGSDLAHFSTFDVSSMEANSADPNLTAQDAGVMIQQGQQVATPSTPSFTANAFAMAYGSTAPQPPLF